MMFLITAPRENIRRCKLPGCTNIIDFEEAKKPKELSRSASRGPKGNDRSAGYKKVRSDKEFCHPKHRWRYDYHYRKKKR